MFPIRSLGPSMPKHLRHVCRFLRCDGRIADYLTAIEHQMQLLGEIRAILPPPLDEHCLHASLDAGVLTLLTDSPVWSSRLRFFTPELERHLTPRHGAIVTCRIRIRIRPDTGVPSSTTSEKASTNRLSTKTARHLMDTAAGIQDTQIAAALRRLAEAHTGN